MVTNFLGGVILSEALLRAPEKVCVCVCVYGVYHKGGHLNLEWLPVLLQY